jgi:hypothetical protein
MKHPLPLLFAFIAVAVLLGLGSMLNNACRSGPHAWCAPPPKVRQAATHGENNRLIGHSVSVDRALSQR